MQNHTILNKIVDVKTREVEISKQSMPKSELEAMSLNMDQPLNFSGALMGDQIRLIAEIKKASPSKGILVDKFNPTYFAEIYARNGSAAISVLTDNHFQGSLQNLADVKKAVSNFRIPVLRKDFIFDPYQVYETRAFGADAFLLIVAILEESQLKELLALGKKLWMQALVEIHNQTELDIAISAGAEIIGINNRDLHTFKTNFEVTEKHAPLIPQGKIIVSESGIMDRSDMLKLQGLGVNAALVGESLVTSHDPKSKILELLGTISPLSGKRSA